MGNGRAAHRVSMLDCRKQRAYAAGYTVFHQARPLAVELGAGRPDGRPNVAQPLPPLYPEVAPLNTQDPRNAGLVEIIRLRLLVGALGECVSPPWWPTQFLSEVGVRRLAQIFPRTPLRAALESVALAAQHDHDRRVGSHLVHLYRLPVGVEMGIADLLHDPGDAAELTCPPHGRDAILKTLTPSAPGQPAQGPQLHTRQETQIPWRTIDVTDAGPNPQ